jgi:6-phosphogluconolactonase/glucosamine-6-phosphate isomerase/deaminase
MATKHHGLAPRHLGSNFSGTQLNSRSEDHLLFCLRSFSRFKCSYKISHEHFQTLPNKQAKQNLSLGTVLINRAGKVLLHAAQVTKKSDF